MEGDEQKRLRQEHSEATLLANARQLLTPPVLSRHVISWSIITEYVGYCFSRLFFDVTANQPTRFSVGFLFKADQASLPDFRQMFQYFSTFQSGVLTAFHYCQFSRAVVSAVSCLPYTDETVRFTLGRLTRLLLFRASELVQCHDLPELKKKVREVAEVGSASLSVVDACFNTGLVAACASPYTEIFPEFLSPQLILHELGKRFKMGAGLLKQAEAAGATSTILHLNSELHTWRAMSEAGGWPARAARQKFVSSFVPELFKPGSKCAGFGLLAMAVSAAFDVSDRVTISMTYCEQTLTLALTKNRCEFVIPVYEDEPLDVTFANDGITSNVRIILKKARVIGRGTLAQAKIQKNPIFLLVEHQFAFGNVFPPYTVQASVLQVGEETLEFLLWAVLDGWLRRPAAGPPLGPYMLATDLALKLGIGSIVFYALFTKIMMIGFCESGDFLDNFVAVILALVTSLQWWPAKPDDDRDFLEDDEQFGRDTLSNAAEFLRERVPQILASQLKHSEHIERPAVPSLMMLISLFDTPEDSEAFFGGILNRVVKDISASVLRRLEFQFKLSRAPLPSQALYRMSHPEEYTLISQRQHLEMTSLLTAAAEMLSRSRIVTAFFTQDAAPLFTDSQTGLLRDFSHLSYLFAAVFASTDPLPTDAELFRFLATYRQLWQLSGSPAESAPAIVFASVIARWLRMFADSFITRVSRAISFDDFTVHSRRHMSSTSVTDIFALISSNFEFLDSLKVSLETIEVHVMCYLSLCGSAVRGYVEALMRLASGFKARNGSARRLTGPQRFVAVNDIIAVRMEWTEFLRKACGDYHLEVEIFSDLLSGVGPALRELVGRLGLDLAIKIRNAVRDAVFLNDAHSYQLKPTAMFDAQEIHETVLEELSQQVTLVQESLLVSYRPRAFVQLVRAVPLGLLEGLSPFVSIRQPQVFFTVVQTLQEMMSPAVDLLEEKLETADFEYVREQTELMDEFHWVSWVASAKDMDLSEVEEFKRRASQVPKKVFLADMAIRQKKTFALGNPPNVVSFLPR
jgi:hypothetical protein